LFGKVKIWGEVIEQERDQMSDLVKVACIAAVTVLVVVGMLIYFSPYHSCVRDNVPASICVGGLPSSK